MTKIDTVPFDKKHKKLLKKQQKAHQKHDKLGGKMVKLQDRMEKLRDKIAAHEETHHEALDAVGQNSQSVSLKKAKR